MYEALGALPVSIEFTEVYMALTQHTVDAIDSALDAAFNQKFYVVCKRCAMSNHIFSVVPLFGSKNKIAALPKDLQTILFEESKGITGFWRSAYSKRIIEEICLMKQNGVAFNVVQYQAFRKAMDPVYASYRTKLGGDILDRVLKAASA